MFIENLTTVRNGSLDNTTNEYLKAEDKVKRLLSEIKTLLNNYQSEFIFR